MVDPIVLLTNSQGHTTPASSYAAALAAALNAQLLLQPVASGAQPVGATAETTARALTKLAGKLPAARTTLLSPDEMAPEKAAAVLARHHPQMLVLDRPTDDDYAEATRAVATDLIAHSAYPLLVVPPTAPATAPRRIAIAVDGDVFNVGEAAPMVRQLIRSTGASVTVLHVTEPASPLHGRDALATVIGGGLVPYSVHPTVKSWINRQPANGILDGAADYDADLLLVITRRRNFWGKLLHTSVSTEVLGRSPIPVLVLVSQ